MLILPRGKAVKEKIGLKNFDILDCLKKLQTGYFTGYLRFDCPEGTGIILLNRGKMIGIYFQGERENLIALRALTSIFENIHAGRSLLHIYSVTTRLLMNLFEILHGNIIYQGQELLLVDVPVSPRTYQKRKYQRRPEGLCGRSGGDCFLPSRVPHWVLP